MKYIDIHCHLNFAVYDADRDEVIRRAQEAGVGMIVVGTTLETSRKAVEIAEANEGIWAIVGLHPIHTNSIRHDPQEGGGDTLRAGIDNGERFDAEAFRELALHKKVVGIGECGLDYFYGETNEAREKQKTAFLAQISLANAVQKPLMLHIRNSKSGENAYQDVLTILKEKSKVLGNTHFFAGSVKDAKDFLDLGYYLSFTGVVTFAKQYKELVEMTPLDRIMTETDAPYVAPVPYRGTRNEPVYVISTTEKIASIKGVSVEEMGKVAIENAKRLFHLE
jgi:TatD DNase family protein